MKSSHRVVALKLLAIALLPASTCWAALNPDLPPKQSIGTVTYRSGGGEPAEAKAMSRAAAGYPLELDFLWGRGAKETPVGNVDWSLRNASGNILLDSLGDGPVVLASLPAGRYTVTAEYDGKTLSRVVDVRKGAHDDVAMEWPQ